MTIFERAFDCGIGSCRATCKCGRVFYNLSGDWDWADGEEKELEANMNATPLDYTVGYVWFENIEYVAACDCWQQRAKEIMNFIDNHAYQIAKYLTLEKKRKTEEAERAPVVE